MRCPSKPRGSRVKTYYRWYWWILAFSLVIHAHALHALTWEFADEREAPWIARAGNASDLTGYPLLQSELNDGLWRVRLPEFELGTNPSIELISPLLHYDSQLFDRVIMRCRLVHSRPLMGELSLSWTNTLNSETPGSDPLPCETLPCSTFVMNTGHVLYTGDWQELVVSDLHTHVQTINDNRTVQVLWEQELIDVRLHLNFFDFDLDIPYVTDESQIPEALEIDWIRLTGPGEQIVGELSPPAAAHRPASDAIFSAAEFYPLGMRGLGHRGHSRLGDFDGDGDLDLVTAWESNTVDDEPGNLVGWLVGVNDGAGRFTEALNHPLPHSGIGFEFYTSDLDGDGLLDLLITSEEHSLLQVMLNRREEGWIRGEEIASDLITYLADANGDGLDDLWLFEIDETRLGNVDFSIRLNDGRGHFPDTQLVPDHLKGGILHIPAQPSERGIGSYGVHWEQQGTIWYVSSLDYAGRLLRQEVLRVPEEIAFLNLFTLYDNDRDGDTDLVGSHPPSRYGYGEFSRGLFFS